MADHLLDFGCRVQESVFEALLDESLYNRMLSGIERMTFSLQDRVRVYRIFATRARSVLIMGPAAPPPAPDYYLV
jgi:CRISPR-associated endonuclease Cas2